MSQRIFIACFFVAGIVWQGAVASDHIDGPITSEHKVTDLTDLYAFSTPGRAGSLSLILNAHPNVSGDGHFPERASYNFILRRASLDTKGAQGGQVSTTDEVQISCTFQTPHHSSNSAVTCQSSNGLTANRKLNSSRSEGDFKVFAGRRLDPFFFNLQWFKTVSTEDKIPSPNDDNTMRRTNVLSLAIDIELEKLFPGQEPGPIAIAASVTTKDSVNSAPRRIDWIGRPEVTNVSFVANGRQDIRDQYNQELPFNINAQHKEQYQARLRHNLNYYDMLDGHRNWSEAKQDQLINLLLLDALIIDPSKPCTKSGYFSIENALLAGAEHTSCGGRKPNEDVMDVLINLYVNNGTGPQISDGVNKPFRPASQSFPYLAAPDDSIRGKARQLLIRTLLKIAQ